MKNIDLIGQTFGSLTVVGRNAEQKSAGIWECVCVCGCTVASRTGNLRKRSSSRCECLRAKAFAERRTAHGKSGTAESRIWNNMRSRCTNPKTPAFARYGARGITVCARWTEFENFLADMGPMPSGEHSIERLDNNGPYEPKNCVWATRLEQMNNKSDNHVVTFRGKSLTLAQWSRETGVDETTLQSRLTRMKWSIERTLTTPAGQWKGAKAWAAKQVTPG